MVHCVFPPAVDEAEAGQQEKEEAEQDCSPDGGTDLLVATLQLCCLPCAVEPQPSSAPGHCPPPGECSPSTARTAVRLSPVRPLTVQVLWTWLGVTGGEDLRLPITASVAPSLLDDLAV